MLGLSNGGIDLRSLPFLIGKICITQCREHVMSLSWVTGRTVVCVKGLEMPLAAMDEESIRNMRVDCDQDTRSPGCEVLLLLLTSEFD